VEDQHIHTGFVMFLTVGVYSVLFIQLVRLGAAYLHNYGPTEKIGTSLGAIVHFG
jgi:hypothetical protein